MPIRPLKTVSRLRVHSFSISIDGFGAGPNQDLQNPLGVGGPALFDWFFHTRTWQQMHGGEDGETGVDDDVAASRRIPRLLQRRVNTVGDEPKHRAAFHL